MDDAIQVSATDLVGHVNCHHLTTLNLRLARGEIEKPKHWDPSLDLLRERGARHEAAYVDHLRRGGLQVTVIEGEKVDAEAVARTLAAMRTGADVIVQAALNLDRKVGRIDVLRRTELPSALGSWSYEVVDTKLARETKGGTVLQLCFYSELLEHAQGTPPAYAHVVTRVADFEPESFRISDYGAYYRFMMDRFGDALTNLVESYPEPVAHCDMCRWRAPCEERRRKDDHLSLVAGISSLQRVELARHDVHTMADLAELPLPVPWKPERGAAASYDRIREQARVQVEGRVAGKVLHELLPIVPTFGLCRLPEPDDGDIFFDLEGDPFAGEGGIEYLFGYACRNGDSQVYVGDWCITPAQEKAAFERFIDFAIERRKTHPALHVYHYAPYEPGALKSLMGRYATREEEVDLLLRGNVLIDLYAVVRHAVRASVESYSIKALEPLYGFDRAIALPAANAALRAIQVELEMAAVPSIVDADKDAVQGYNKDDCLSTAALRDWLEDLRTRAIAESADIARPPLVPDAATPEITAWQARVDALVLRLMDGVPLEQAARSQDQQAMYVLAHILDWHRREKKATWWEYFRLAGLSAEELYDEKSGISGLSFVGQVGGTPKAPIHRYAFPPQDAEFRGGEEIHSVGGAKLGRVEAIDAEHRLIDIKKRGDTAAYHPDALFEHGDVNTGVLAESLMKLGEYVADHGLRGDGPLKAARDLLLRLPPNVAGSPLLDDSETVADAARRLGMVLAGVLPIQGPPGAGKTYTASRMIVDLVRAGRRVGVTANSHKVIRNVLDAAIAEADEVDFDLRCIHKVSEKTDDVPHIAFTTSNDEALAGFATGKHVVSGTGWMWARPDAVGAVDVLFVDEAAQMSLANVLAISSATTSLVLLGDPQQLEQPMQGAHPEHTDVSALDHLLAGRRTISETEGLFLDQTWRLHPDICAFTSELFYDDRLTSRPGLENQAILRDGQLGGTGLRYVPVEHEGNQSSSPEEADRVAALVGALLDGKTKWRDRKGTVKDLESDDILIIAPYNAQVFEIRARLPNARVGTVDKFQGQEAPIVVYSLATSSHADAPRGMEFLYSANRLNVATSRARCLCIIVANPAVFEPECRTPSQMRLANGFSRYLEMATSTV